MADVYTDAGQQWTADIFDGTTSPSTYWIGWGTSTTLATSTQTALVSEATEDRVAATMSQPSADTNRATATLTAGTSKSVGEAGLFTSSSAGTMVVRSNFDATPLSTGDTIEFTVDIQWST